MNKIYRKVWNATLGQWVVASELAGNRRGRAAGGVTMRGAGLRALGALMMMGGMHTAYAQVSVVCMTADGDAIGSAAPGGVSCGHVAFAQGDYSVAVGYNSLATGENNIAIGRLAWARGTRTIAIGSNAGDTNYVWNNGIIIGHSAEILSQSSVAIGNDANVFYGHDNSIALGTSSRTIRGPLTGYTAPFLPASQNSIGTLGIGTSAGQRQITGVAAGLEGTDAVNVSQLQAAINSTGWTVAAGSSSAAIGPGGTVTFAVGSNLTVTRTGTAPNSQINLALSSTPTLTSVTTGGTLLNNNGLTTGSGNPSVTINGIDAGGDRITNVGPGINGTDAVNVNQLNGARTRYYSVNSTGSGNLNNDGATGTNAIAAGMDAQAIGTDAVALGRGAQASLVNSVALGSLARAGDNAVALGKSTTADGRYAVALGSAAHADAGYGIAVGEGAQVTASSSNSIALGSDSSATHANSVALGALSMTTVGAQSGYDAAFLEAPQTSFGEIGIGVSGGGTRKITGVAAGSEFTDAVNVSQLQAVADIAGAGWTLTDADGNSSNIGPGATVTFEGDANMSVAQTGADDAGVIAVTLNRDLDLDSVTTGDTMIDTTGLAVGDTAVGATGVAVGADVFLGATGLVINGGPSVTTAGIDAGSLAITSVGTGINGTDAVNVDQMNSAITTARTRYYSVNSTGGGNEDNDGATGTDAIAAGKDAEAEGDEAVALGHGAVASGEAGVAFGAGAQALSLNSLAFGAGAVAGHANSIALGAGSATTVGAQSGYAGAYVGTSDSTGEMNIGGRQVTGVAAGSADTDAVNVSQLQGGVDHAITESNAYTDAQVADANDAIAGLDSRVTGIEGDITDIHEDISQLDGRMTGVEDSVVNLGETATEFDNRLNEIESGADGMFQVNPEGEYAKPQATGANAAAGGKDAVASGDNSMAVGNQSTASGDNSLAMGQGARASHANSVALGQGAATTVGAQTDYEAAYVGASTSAGEVNVGSRTISGVAPGIAGTDAVNINQLGAGVNHAIREANSYTDQRIEQIQNDVQIGNDELRRDMNAAVASALAVKQAPWVPGKTTYYAGVAGYRGQGAVGVSLRRTAYSGRWSLEGGFTQNRDGSGAYMGVSGVLGD